MNPQTEQKINKATKKAQTGFERIKQMKPEATIGVGVGLTIFYYILNKFLFNNSYNFPLLNIFVIGSLAGFFWEILRVKHEDKKAHNQEEKVKEFWEEGQ